MTGSRDRAASEVIGAVIIFAFLILTFAIYQGVVIPQQNREIEFQQNQAAQESMQDLRNAIRQTATTGGEASVSIKLSARYPPRVLGINPGVSAGSVRTADLGSIRIDNITATDPETADYFGASALGPFETKSLTYRPLYTHYQLAPITVYENSVAFNQFDSGVNLTITNQAVIDGRKITLIALGGNVSAARQGALTVDTRAVSTATTRISVTNETGPITLTIPTRLTAANWTDVLEDELDSGSPDDRYVQDVKPAGPNQVAIVLEPDIEYELRLAKVGVGTGAASEGAKYIVDEEGDDTSVIENGTQKLVVQVRDRFNNPVSNVSVTAGTPTEGTLDTTTGTTDANGLATFLYSAPESVDSTVNVDIDVSFDGDGTANETVRFDVRVLDADGSGGGDGGVSEVNPSGEDRLVLEVADGTNTETADLTFNNTADSNIVVTEMRVPFYFEESGGQDETEVVESFAGVGSFEGAENLSIGATLTELDSSVTFPQDTSTVTIVFGGSGSNLQTQGDFFILVLRFDSGTTATYFVTPQ